MCIFFVPCEITTTLVLVVLGFGGRIASAGGRAVRGRLRGGALRFGDGRNPAGAHRHWAILWCESRKWLEPLSGRHLGDFCIFPGHVSGGDIEQPLYMFALY